MSILYDEVALLATGLCDGDTLRAECPSCQGGSSHEKSLSILKTQSGLLYHCFRARCSLSGGRGVPSGKVNKPKRKVWQGSVMKLNGRHKHLIRELWHIERPPSSWYWTPDYNGRVAMSIRSYKDVHRGWLLRSLNPRSRSKALTFVDEGEDALSWYKTVPGSGTILVEDIPSAVRASLYTNSVALCGTGIGPDRATEIAEYASRPITIALDNDATDLSFKWAKKYSLLWDDVIVLPLEKDLKNMTEENLDALLRS